MIDPPSLHQDLVILWEARAVIKYLSDCQLISVSRKFRKELRQLIFILKSPLLDEHHNGHRGELFRERGEAKGGIRRNRRSRCEIREAVSFLKTNLPVLNYDYSSTGRIAFTPCCEKGIHFFDDGQPQAERVR